MNKCVLSIPVFLSPVQAGFPSPADDYIEESLDLNRYLIKKPAATFIVKARGDSMMGAGIAPGDLLIVDRSLEPMHRSIVVAMLNGLFTVKRLIKKNGEMFLFPENPKHKEIKIEPSHDFEVWGVVAHVIKSFKIG
jgi:DNA polymerase V